MGDEVYANGMAIACASGDGKVVAAFPSVCQSPPGPPAGPIPVPYPLTSHSRDLKAGSKRVRIGGKPVALQGQSYYQSKPLGNEAATRSFGASILTHQVAGKTQFASGSIDVKFEGKKVCRHLDATTSNHGSEPGEGPTVNLETAKPAKPDKPVKHEVCPCCKIELHRHQFDPDTGEAYDTIDELDWYQSGVDQAKAIYDKKMTPANIAAIHASKSADEAARILGEIQRKYDEACAAMQTLRDARANGVECPNLNQPGSDCGVFFVKTNPEPPTGTEKGRRKIGFDDGDARRICQKWRAAGYSWSTGSEIIHKTPLRGRRMP